MGGSSLAPEVFRLVHGLGQIGEAPALDLAILDSTDPTQVRAASIHAPVEKSLFIVSSKSGTTTEINAFLEFFWARAVAKLGDKAGEHFIAITDPGTRLEKLARERGFRAVIAGDPLVGGRYSALTAFGLLPAALIGMNLTTLLDRAVEMMRQCLPGIPAGRNPGLVLGALIGKAALDGRDKLTILADPELEPIGSWLEQLIAESSGKGGRGIVPIDLEPVMPAEFYWQDRLFVYLRLNGERDEFLRKLRAAGQPAVEFQFQDAYDLGAEFYRWEMAVAVACAMLRVNAFDQPDVQDNKNRTTQKIKAFKINGVLDSDPPVWEGPGGRVYGLILNGLDKAESLRDAVSLLLNLARPGDYIAINVYLPRSQRMLSRLQKLRKAVMKQTGCATTLGFGPRFLHSTGQLHKGGANNGVFLQITATPPEDLDIPNFGISFGTLELAQALGDLEALLNRDRRAIRVHLTDGRLEDLI
jgi:transaldolase/glucose-6-phosphate isomerase